MSEHIKFKLKKSEARKYFEDKTIDEKKLQTLKNLEKVSKCKNRTDIPVPKKCIQCNGVNLNFKDPYWKCLDCGSEFQWKKFIAVFEIDVEFESDPDDAETIAWEMLENGECTLMGYWENGKYNAHLKLSMEEREEERN